ncbi:hypothetical protein F4827_003086 [Paraburkholderia bannensis]|uniref:Uncharacterized protein n=1 Tax=Paraburkholderia bannensis TaxID=765414 RepID=A0A7W9TXI3_9BURK|nr:MULTISPECIES: hypothetical protein [Paraburkholderia]MBB3258218.1 hypothetical protein [Paraburkholderia sp. WP4_3_2]MBB6103231.1 hypothetical protein [Paraburkholderia bannensis]
MAAATKEQADEQVKRVADRTLVVVHAFGDYRRGDSITDPDEVDAVLKSENAHHCRKVIPQ